MIQLPLHQCNQDDPGLKRCHVGWLSLRLDYIHSFIHSYIHSFLSLCFMFKYIKAVARCVMLATVN